MARAACRSGTRYRTGGRSTPRRVATAITQRQELVVIDADLFVDPSTGLLPRGKAVRQKVSMQDPQ
jgi:hypothetical protein